MFPLNINHQMATHFLFIQNPPECPTFNFIKSGIKTVEGRTYKQKYHSFKIGDHLVFRYNDQSINTTIVDIKLYATLEEYVEKEGYEKVLPGTRSANEAICLYNDNLWSIAQERNDALNLFGYGF